MDLGKLDSPLGRRPSWNRASRDHMWRGVFPLLILVATAGALIVSPRKSSGRHVPFEDITPPVSVRVVDTAGEPVIGATTTLHFVPSLGMEWQPGTALIDSAISDELGQCVMRIPRLTTALLAATSDTAMAEPTPVSAGDQVTLVIRPTHPITLRIIDDETEAPVADAHLEISSTLLSVSGEYYFGALGTFASGADGICRMSLPLPTGEITVEHLLYDQRLLPPITARDIGTVKTIRVEPVPTWHVRLVTPDGHDIAHAEFESGVLDPSPRYSESKKSTDEGGVEYTEHLLRASAGDIRVRAPGYRVTPVPLGGSSRSGVVRMQLARAGELRARLVGFRPDDLKVTVVSGTNADIPSLWRQTITPDPDGLIHVPCLSLDRRVVLVVSGPEIGHLGWTERFASGSSVIDLGDIALKPKSQPEDAELPRIIGRVVDSYNDPIAHVIIGDGRHFSDNNGRFSLLDTSGTFRKPGYRDEVADSGIVDPDGDLVITMRNAPKVSGRVLDDLGIPVPFARVNVSRMERDEGPRVTWADREGRYLAYLHSEAETIVYPEAPGYFPSYPFHRTTVGRHTDLRLHRNTFVEIQLEGPKPTGWWTVESRIPPRRIGGAPRHEPRTRIQVLPNGNPITIHVPGFETIEMNVVAEAGEVLVVPVRLRE